MSDVKTRIELTSINGEPSFDLLPSSPYNSPPPLSFFVVDLHTFVLVTKCHQLTNCLQHVAFKSLHVMLRRSSVTLIIYSFRA